MTILLVSIYDTDRSGGLSTHVAEVAAGLRRLGHDVVVATPYSVAPSWWRRLVQDLPRLPMRALRRDAAFIHFVTVARRLLARGISRLAASRPVDVVHAHDPVAYLAARDALRRDGARATASRARLVLTVHGDTANLAESDGAIGPRGSGRRVAEGLEAEAYRDADVLIAVDDRLRTHCLALGGDRPIEVLANFVDVERFRPARAADREALRAMRRGLALGDDARVLLCPRRLVPKTGVIFAVRAMGEPSLEKLAGGHVVLLVAGDGAQRSVLESEARRLGLDARPDREGTPRVRFLGDVPRADLAMLYRLSDVVLVPSVPDAGVVEATSLTALEAMATGKVVVASAIGGLAQLITSGRTGVLVPPGAPDALAAAIARVLGDPESAGRIGAAARETVERERSTGACVARLVAIYTHAAGESA